MWDWESFRCEEEASSITTFGIHPGEWNATYASLSRFEDKAGECKAVSDASSLLQKIAGGAIGFLLVVAVIGVLNYFRQDPQRFRKMIMSFMLNEVNVIVSLSAEIWDFAGGVILAVIPRL